MSHELRTPLNAVIGFSEILSGELFGALGDKRYVSYAGDILKSGRHLLEVINNVLDLARSESGSIEIEKRTLDLVSLLNESAVDIRARCAAAKIAFEMSIGTSPMMIDADEAKLKQIVRNLLSNAVKFTDAGGAVNLIARADAEAVQIEVHDTGIGMNQADVETALTPFAQVDARLERRYEGTGIGLPLTKAFVESHGGTIALQSEPGRGTIVIVRLPRALGDTVAPQRKLAAG